MVFGWKGIVSKRHLGGVKNGNNKPLINPLTGKEDPIPPGGFRYKTEKLKELQKDNRIHFHTDGSLPRLKRYLDENLKQRPKSIMSDDQRPDYKLLKSMKIDFDNPKQMTFMKRILSIFNKNSLILDFFAGSGTTGHAVVQLNKEDGGNRKYILCTNNENNICEEVTYKRLKNIQKELPHNLKYLKTDYIPKISKDEDDLSIRKKVEKNIKELIELENHIEIDNQKYIIAESEEKMEEDINRIEKNGILFLPPGIFLSSTEQRKLDEKNIKLVNIPEYYFRNELREAGEL